MGLANVPWGFQTSQWEGDYQMCPGNGTSQSALGMGLANVPWE